MFSWLRETAGQVEIGNIVEKSSRAAGLKHNFFFFNL